MTDWWRYRGLPGGEGCARGNCCEAAGPLRSPSHGRVCTLLAAAELAAAGDGRACWGGSASLWGGRRIAGAGFAAGAAAAGPDAAGSCTGIRTWECCRATVDADIQASPRTTRAQAADSARATAACKGW